MKGQFSSRQFFHKFCDHCRLSRVYRTTLKWKWYVLWLIFCTCCIAQHLDLASHKTGRQRGHRMRTVTEEPHSGGCDSSSPCGELGTRAGWKTCVLFCRLMSKTALLCQVWGKLEVWPQPRMFSSVWTKWFLLVAQQYIIYNSMLWNILYLSKCCSSSFIYCKSITFWWTALPSLKASTWLQCYNPTSSMELCRRGHVVDAARYNHEMDSLCVTNVIFHTKCTAVISTVSIWCIMMLIGTQAHCSRCIWYRCPVGKEGFLLSFGRKLFAFQ